MRIGIDARLWNESGVGRYLRNLTAELALIDTQNEYVLFFKQEEYHSVMLPGKNFKKILADVHWHTVAEQFLLPRILQKEYLDLMHFPYFSIPLFYKGKFVVTIHDLILHHYMTGKATTLPQPLYFIKYLGYKYLILQAAKRAEKIIAVSYATKKEIIDHLHISPEKITVTYEGVDIKNGKSFDKPPIDTPFFLHVGNMYPHKNIHLLIEAFSKSFSHADVQLVFVGREDYFYKNIQKYVLKNKIKGIRFLGYVSDEELSALYRYAQAVVVPSFMEGFGLPAVEAMAKESIIILSDISVHREVCGDAGIYFDPENKQDLARCLQMVYSKAKKDFKKNIAHGLEKTKHYSWKTMAKKTKELYERSAGV